jgi:hypothetical protein
MMKREECFEGMNVRVIDNPSDAYPGQTGVVIQIWPIGFKWDDYATVDFGEDTAHILFEDLEPYEVNDELR